MEKTRQAQVQQVLFDFYKNPVARVSLELIFSILAVVFFAIFAIKPTLETMADLIKEIEDKRALDEQLQQKLASLNTAQSQYQQFSGQFYLLDEAIPKRPRLVEALKIIEKIASDNSLVIQSITVSAVPEELEEALAGAARREMLTFNVNVTGEYLVLRQYIEDLMAARRLLIVDQVNFGFGSSRYRNMLSAVIRINVPYYAQEK